MKLYSFVASIHNNAFFLYYPTYPFFTTGKASFRFQSFIYMSLLYNLTSEEKEYDLTPVLINNFLVLDFSQNKYRKMVAIVGGMRTWVRTYMSDGPTDEPVVKMLQLMSKRFTCCLLIFTKVNACVFICLAGGYPVLYVLQITSNEKSGKVAVVVRVYSSTQIKLNYQT